MRAFIGIKLDQEVNKSLEALQKQMYQDNIRGNYSLVNNIHLTLDFLGEIEESDIEIIKSIIDKIKCPKIIKLTGIKMLRDMIICEVQKSEELLTCQKKLVQLLREQGYRVDNKPYYPHITLVRQANKTINYEVSLESQVTKISLFESTRINNKLCYIEK